MAACEHFTLFILLVARFETCNCRLCYWSLKTFLVFHHQPHHGIPADNHIWVKLGLHVTCPCSFWKEVLF